MTAFLSESTHRMLLRYHPTLGHLFVPNQRARLMNEVGGYTVVTNSAGFRSDIEFKRERGDRPRILAFGDSTMAGDNGPNSIRYMDCVGERLGAEVYNFGVSGTGTDQPLLVLREYAKGIEADLIVLAVQVDAIRRVQASSRESIDRTTGHRIMASKPYFSLDGGGLRLNNVPVPMTRPSANGGATGVNHAPGALRGALWALAQDARLESVRKSVRSKAPRLQSEFYRMAGFQPYREYLSEETPGWKLLEAIIRQFISEVSPVPVLLYAVPTAEFFLHGAEPVFLPLFERFRDPARGVHVADLTTPLRAQTWQQRYDSTFRQDPHFSEAGNRTIADILSREIEQLGLLPARARTAASTASAPAPAAAPAVVSKPAAAKGRYILGVSCFYHNSAACLIEDGRIVAAGEEERFTRVKNDRRFPHQAVNACLEQGRVEPEDLAAVVFYDNAARTFERLFHSHIEKAETAENSFAEFVPSWLAHKLFWPQVFRDSMKHQGLILQTDHHRSHAASAFFPSPFERAAVLTVDGVGEWATASIGVANGSDLRLLKEMRFHNSLGLLYSAFTQFTGFKVNSGEYKMMGLASYGQPTYAKLILDEIVDIKDDGSIALNLDYFAFLDGRSMISDRFAKAFGGPARQPDARITRREIDLARSIQVVTEEALLRMARHAHKLTGEKNLCMAGGVALNCVANGRLLREGPFENLWIQPAAGDSGGAIGAALDAYHTYFGQPRPSPGGRSQQGASYLGPSFSEDEIRAFLTTYGVPHTKLSKEERADTIAALLDDGKAVGHVADRMEFGPRSLGARSILGDARNTEMQATLNLKIKYRESFRPFAPSVLRERVHDYFELDGESPYMLLVAPVQPARRKPHTVALGDDLLPVVRDVRSDLPAITHVDYSARIQTVAKEDAPIYYDVIRAFEKRTGTAVIVITSFNVRGEPIVCTPFDAYRCFMRTEMDALVLGDFLLHKEGQPAWREPKGEVGSDDVETVVAKEAPDPAARRLEKKLRGVYRTSFLPIARQLLASGEGGLATKQKAESTWVDHSAPASVERLFTVPRALDNPYATPAEIADAIQSSWRPGAAKAALRPVLIDLMKARPKEQKETEETVSTSVYVMF